MKGSVCVQYQESFEEYSKHSIYTNVTQVQVLEVCYLLTLNNI